METDSCQGKLSQRLIRSTKAFNGGSQNAWDHIQLEIP